MKLLARSSKITPCPVCGMGGEEEDRNSLATMGEADRLGGLICVDRCGGRRIGIGVL